MKPLLIQHRCEGEFGRPDHRYCSPGLYCSDQMTCQTTYTTGQKCDSTKPCEFGNICIKPTTGDQHTCQTLFSQKNGELVDLTKVFSISAPAYSTNEICDSTHIFTNDQGTFCMPGPISSDQSIGDRKRKEGAGQPWEFKAFLEPTNLEQAMDLSDLSQWGFNVDNSGYCDLRRGDQDYLEALKAYQPLFELDTSKCHLLSSLLDWVDLDDDQTEVVQNWKKMQFINVRLSLSTF